MRLVVRRQHLRARAHAGDGVVPQRVPPGVLRLNRLGIERVRRDESQVLRERGFGGGFSPPPRRPRRHRPPRRGTRGDLQQRLHARRVRLIKHLQVPGRELQRLVHASEQHVERLAELPANLDAHESMRPLLRRRARGAVERVAAQPQRPPPPRPGALVRGRSLLVARRGDDRRAARAAQRQLAPPRARLRLRRPPPLVRRHQLRRVVQREIFARVQVIREREPRVEGGRVVREVSLEKRRVARGGGGGGDGRVARLGALLGRLGALGGLGRPPRRATRRFLARHRDAVVHQV
eukprot:31530-Pelagococcus_subviridis.AAC.14